MSAPRLAQRFLIYGRVQGVFYRGSARAEAIALGLNGWVRNLSNGCVEAYACGEAGALARFEVWLNDGPRGARVTRVERYVAEFEALRDFEVR